MLNKISNEDLKTQLQQLLGAAILDTEESFGMLSITVAADIILETCKKLKTDANLSFQFLTDLCGMHFPDNSGKEFGMVYHLHSFRSNTRLRIRCFMSAENPTVPSITELWPAANWQERETYDFFGIHFSEHPNLKRIMNMDEMDYHPLRKEYALEDETREDKNDNFFGR